MGFERLTNYKPEKPGTVDISNGSRLQWRSFTRKGKTTSFAVLVIGKDVAPRLALQLPNHKMHLMFGRDEDKGRLAITVDNADGEFLAKRTKRKEYYITIPVKSVEGRLKPGFATLANPVIEICKLDPSKPVFGIIDIHSAVA
jgi:hypothetical protein